jgi:hypothetical protein
MMTKVPWTIQGLLAFLFLFAGGMKLMLPIEAPTAQLPLVAGLLCASVAHARWRPAPHRGSARPSLRQPSASRG